MLLESPHKPRVLLVDDEPRLLEGCQRHLRRNFDVTMAPEPQEGLETIDQAEPFAVVVSDMNMPVMNGVQFLAEVRKKQPEAVRIILTGNANLQAAMQAVNEGAIFRFLTKPCLPGVLTRAIQLGVEQHQLIVAERELIEKTLTGSVKLLTDVLSLTNPAAFGRCARMRKTVEQLAQALQLEKPHEASIAAMFSHIGCVSVPAEILEKVEQAQQLDLQEQEIFDNHPRLGGDLLSNVPRLEQVATAVAWQHQRFDDPQQPGPHGHDIPQAARLLKIALDFDTLSRQLGDEQQALEAMKRRVKWYDPQALEALCQALGQRVRVVERSVRVRELDETMTIARDLRTTSGMLLVVHGQQVSASLKSRLTNDVRTGQLEGPISVLCAVSEEQEAALRQGRLSTAQPVRSG